MTHLNEKKAHGLKGIGEKLNPTIYQVRFMKLDEPIQFESFPKLKELGNGWVLQRKCGRATQLCTSTAEKSLKRSF